MLKTLTQGEHKYLVVSITYLCLMQQAVLYLVGKSNLVGACCQGV